MQANGKEEVPAEAYEDYGDRDMTQGELEEGRSRLAAGLKRYFHGKRLEGLLSNQVGICHFCLSIFSIRVDDAETKEKYCSFFSFGKPNEKRGGRTVPPSRGTEAILPRQAFGGSVVKSGGNFAIFVCPLYPQA